MAAHSVTGSFTDRYFLFPPSLCADIIRSFIRLDEDTQHRNIVAWRPVVIDVIEGYTNFPPEGFDKYIETFYTLGVDLLSRDLSPDIRLALRSLLRRVGRTRLGVQAPSEASGSRRSSVVSEKFVDGSNSDNRSR